ncbi:MAG: hypothetical protein M3P85_09480 [Actinomycetota bacterium]|nr:hypothetical protein [Actinomycetota bacterium]
MARLALAVLTAAGASALAAVILGEYDLRGITPLVSAVMLALVIGELAVVVAGSRSVVLGIACAVTVGAGVVWALWISSGNDWSFVSASGWVGAALAVLTALVWVAPRQRLRGSGPREDDSRLEP